MNDSRNCSKKDESQHQKIKKQSPANNIKNKFNQDQHTSH